MVLVAANDIRHKEDMERERNMLATVLSFIYVRVKIYVGDISIQNRTARINHSIGDLRADTDRVANREIIPGSAPEPEDDIVNKYHEQQIRLFRKD